MATDFCASRRALEEALRDPVLTTEAHYLLWEVCHACGDPDAAAGHLDAAIRRNPLRTRPPRAGVMPSRSVLALATPGDLQANLPLPMLLDHTTLLHTLFLTGTRGLPDLPAVDCVFIAIAEDERHRACLDAADVFARSLGRPVINDGATIAGLSRTGVSRRLAGLADTIVPFHTARSREQLLLAAAPFIVRPLGSHAGRGLALIRTRADLDRYLELPGLGDLFSTAPFIDFRAADGLYRKARIVFVDGEPLPLHLAIHDDWAIWYYNAGMASCTAKQDEERHFLAGLDAWAGERAASALRAIPARIGLDYFGLDCAVLADGRLLVFEIETGMIVHDHDAEPHKRAAAHRVFRAVECLLDQRIARARELGFEAVSAGLESPASVRTRAFRPGARPRHRAAASTRSAV